MSDKLCAGSVDANKIFFFSDNFKAIEELVVVFPTPPFPPTNINFNSFYSNISFIDFYLTIFKLKL